MTDMTPEEADKILSKNFNFDEPHNTDQLDWWFAKGFLAGIEYEREAAKGLIKALEYCAVEPKLLQPENNRQCAVAMNALAAYKARTEGK